MAVIFLGEKIYHLAIEMNKVLDREFEYTGLRFGQVQMLLHLYELSQRGKIPVSQEKLTRQMHIDKSNVSRNIKKLVQTGYINVETDYRDDRNRKIIYFTTESDAKMEGCFEILSKILRQMTRGIGDEHLAVTEETLLVLIRNLGEVRLTEERQQEEINESDRSEYQNTEKK